MSCSEMLCWSILSSFYFEMIAEKKNLVKWYMYVWIHGWLQHWPVRGFKLIGGAGKSSSTVPSLQRDCKSLQCFEDSFLGCFRCKQKLIIPYWKDYRLMHILKALFGGPLELSCRVLKSTCISNYLNSFYLYLLMTKGKTTDTGNSVYPNAWTLIHL